MKEFILTSPILDGSLLFGYDEDGRLVKFENKARLSQPQKDVIYDPAQFPFRFEQLPLLRGKQGKIEEIQDITWERFWKEYDYKKGKIRAEMEWNKLKKDEQAKAIAMIKRYKYFCDTHSHEVLYPERYLKYKRFNDE